MRRRMRRRVNKGGTTLPPAAGVGNKAGIGLPPGTGGINKGGTRMPRGAGEIARGDCRQRICGRLEHRHGRSGGTAAHPRRSGRVPGCVGPEDQQRQERCRSEPQAERGGGSALPGLVVGPEDLTQGATARAVHRDEGVDRGPVRRGHPKDRGAARGVRASRGSVVDSRPRKRCQRVHVVNARLREPAFLHA